LGYQADERAPRTWERGHLARRTCAIVRFGMPQALGLAGWKLALPGDEKFSAIRYPEIW